MGRTIKMPLGRVPEDQIKTGVDATVETIAAALRRQFESPARVEVEAVSNQNEVTKDNRTVGLKVYKKRVKLREGTFAGANVTLEWHRDRPNEIDVAMSTESVFEEWCCTAAFVVAGIAAVGACIWLKLVSKLVAIVAFFTALVPAMIPYWIISAVMAKAGTPFLDSVEETVRGVVAPG